MRNTTTICYITLISFKSHHSTITNTPLIFQQQLVLVLLLLMVLLLLVVLLLMVIGFKKHTVVIERTNDFFVST